MTPGVPPFDGDPATSLTNLLSPRHHPFHPTVVNSNISHYLTALPPLPECSNRKGQSQRVGRHVTRVSYFNQASLTQVKERSQKPNSVEATKTQTQHSKQAENRKKRQRNKERKEGQTAKGFFSQFLFPLLIARTILCCCYLLGFVLFDSLKPSHFLLFAKFLPHQFTDRDDFWW